MMVQMSSDEQPCYRGRELEQDKGTQDVEILYGSRVIERCCECFQRYLGIPRLSATLHRTARHLAGRARQLVVPARVLPSNHLAMHHGLHAVRTESCTSYGEMRKNAGTQSSASTKPKSDLWSFPSQSC